jgi:two-component system, NarL family, nitrate/nitrite response regulator NarL
MTRPNILHVLIIDDHPLIVAGMQKMLAAIDELRITGTAGSAIEALKILKTVPVDIVLLDINLPDINGIELCKKIRKEFPAVKVLGISTYCDRSYVSRMIENGALGYLAKSADAEEIVTAIRTASEGRLYLSLSTEHLLQAPAAMAPAGLLPALTRREKEVLQLIAEGLTNTQIAEKLFISPLTVDSHRKNLHTKLNVNNTAALIRLAVEHRLV